MGALPLRMPDVIARTKRALIYDMASGEHGDWGNGDGRQERQGGGGGGGGSDD